MAESNVIALSTSDKLSAPQNLQAEQALLGALLINNKTVEHVVEFLEPHHFCDRIHGEIYKAINTLIEQGRIADPITLQNYFQSRDLFESIGGMRYLVQLVESVISVVSVKDYGTLIYDLYLRREIIDIGECMVKEARQCDIEQTATETIENAEKQLFSLVMSKQRSSDFITFSKALSEAIARAETAYKRESHIVGISTGLIELDRMLGGLHPSDLIILAGRPSMGKTALATNIAFNASNLFVQKGKDEGGPVAFFSLEMSAEQLASRILSTESAVPSDQIRRGAIKFEDFPKFLEIAENLQNLPLYIDDTPGLSIMNLRNRARRLKRQYDIQLIVIDYLQLLTLGGEKRGFENRVQEVSEITRSLKALAKELDVPVIALSQLSRAVEQREDKKPQLADLRESGTIEQDADVVMFVYREEYYASRKMPESGTDKHNDWVAMMNRVHNKAELIIAKQRHGPIGNVSLFFDGRLTKFGNLV